MAGGMTRRPGETLEERSRRSRAGATRMPGTTAPPSRHCWVVDPPDRPGRWAGVLLAWRRAERGWQGQVVFVVDDADPADPAATAAVCAWVAAEQLEPLPAHPAGPR